MHYKDRFKAFFKVFKKDRKFYITENGFYFRKSKKLYQWHEIVAVNGYWIPLIDSDSIVIRFLFTDSFEFEVDETMNGFLSLMDTTLPAKLHKYNLNWYIDINSQPKKNNRVEIYKK